MDSGIKGSNAPAQKTQPLSDMLGNEIRVGSLVYWAETKLLCRVTSLTDGNMTIGAAIGLPKDGQLREFVLAVDPVQQELVESIAKETESALATK